MRIAINCRSILLNQRTGIGRYTYHLIENLGRIDQVDEYFLHAPKGFFDLKRNLPDFSAYPNLKKCMDYWRRGVGKTDIYHLPSPDAILPYSAKLIVTIHDLIYKTHAQSHSKQAVELIAQSTQAAVSQANHIICISENTRRDLHAAFNIPVEKTSVIYHGVDHQLFFQLSAQERLEAVAELKNIGISKPYMLFVGTIEPRKNLAGLLKSFALLKSKKIFHGTLVVTGMKGWMVENIQGLIKKLGIQQQVIFTGYVTDTQLRQLYNIAEIFVFPSFYEGFGFPILEAFCCGTPVVTSKTSSCAEIASQAALTINPEDIKAITGAMERILTDKKLKKSLIQAGLERAKEFSFSTTAQKTLETYRALMV